MVMTDRVPPDYIKNIPPDHGSTILGMHDTCSGRIFMLGTGPSLIDQLPLLERLKDEVTFGCNTLARWDALPFSPTYYGISDVHDPGSIDTLGELIPESTIAFNVRWPKYYTGQRFHAVSKAHDSRQFHSHGLVGFGDDLPGLSTGRTTPLTLVQVAIWLGYRQFYFLGIEQSRGYCYDPETRVSGFKQDSFPLDKNPKYRIAVKKSAQRMRTDIEAAGGSVFDCTPGGLLNVTGKGIHTDVPAGDILPYKDLAEVLA